MRRVFLSYRRDDSQTATHILFKHLEGPSAFGPGAVFMDIHSIGLGTVFPTVIDENVSRCEVFLAVIGRRWLTTRLHDPTDFVRLEIEAALRRERLPVVPVLVDNAELPEEADLPESLRPLLRRNGHRLRPSDLDYDLDRLVRKLLMNDDGDIKKGRAPGDRFEHPLPDGPPMPFAWCPPGTFQMGSPESERDRRGDETRHEVRLTRGFWMGVHPVTRVQFARFVAATGYRTDAERSGGGRLRVIQPGGVEWVQDAGCTWRTPGIEQGADHPVVVTSWNDAAAFCAWASARRAVRLPTEAEWEYAARGGMATPFPWGSELNGTQANCDGTAPWGTRAAGPFLRGTSAVGRYATRAPHPWGLTDVIGNVWEWCSDWYAADFYDRSPTADPECRDGERTERVLRGGAWSSPAANCRAARRYRWHLAEGYDIFGFRLVLPEG